MTSHRLARCCHCQSRYYYQASGPNPPDDDDDRYCPTCYKAVRKALAKVPVRYEQTWIPTTEVTLKQLQKWEAENEAKSNIRRVGVPLYKMDENKNGRSVCIDVQLVRIVRGRGEFEGRTYEYRYWEKDKDPHKNAEIRMEVERDLQTGLTCPWLRI